MTSVIIRVLTDEIDASRCEKEARAFRAAVVFYKTLLQVLQDLPLCLSCFHKTLLIRLFPLPHTYCTPMTRSLLLIFQKF